MDYATQFIKKIIIMALKVKGACKGVDFRNAT
jgi:hypothetical protein